MSDRFHSERLKWGLTAALILWAAVIFFFSAQPGNVSGEQSHRISEFLANFFNLHQFENVLHSAEIIVRKCAHVAEYAVFGALTALCLSFHPFGFKTRFGLSVLAAMAYGATDEIHQFFVPGRTSRLYDVGFDTFGGTIGALITLLIVRAYFKRKAEQRYGE